MFISGPAIILNQTSTILVEPGCQAEIDNFGNVIIEVKQDIQQLNEKEESLLQEFVSAGMTGQETAQIDIQERAADKTLLADVSEQELNEFLEQSEFITSTETNE